MRKARLTSIAAEWTNRPSVETPTCFMFLQHVGLGMVDYRKFCCNPSKGPIRSVAFCWKHRSFIIYSSGTYCISAKSLILWLKQTIEKRTLQQRSKFTIKNMNESWMFQIKQEAKNRAETTDWNLLSRHFRYETFPSHPRWRRVKNHVNYHRIIWLPLI